MWVGVNVGVKVGVNVCVGGGVAVKVLVLVCTGVLVKAGAVVFVAVAEGWGARGSQIRLPARMAVDVMQLAFMIAVTVDPTSWLI